MKSIAVALCIACLIAGALWAQNKIEASPADGLAITDAQGTQIQRKLGP